jgi:secondary thiamine-phosphate synthase enzyme
MKQAHTRLQVSTSGKGLYDFTRTVERWVSEQGVANGLLTVFVQHTSCSLVIQENADPDVTADLRDYFERLVPANVEQYRHTAEGPDDMTSHIRTTLTGVSTGVPVIGGRMTLGTWQGLYLFEHRDAPHRRNVVLHLMGD